MATKQGPSKVAIGVGVGVAAAAAAAAAGAYWLYGAKHSAEHRKMAKGWMLNARAEVLNTVEKLKDIDKSTYMKVVDGVLAKYASKAGASSVEVAHMMRDFKEAWNHMETAHTKVAKSTGVAKKVVRKAATSKAPKTTSKK